MVSSQLYGPGFCLLSRLDVVPCTKFFPTTPDPREKYGNVNIMGSVVYNIRIIHVTIEALPPTRVFCVFDLLEKDHAQSS